MSIDGPDHGLGSWPGRRARITPDRVALVQGDRRLTYAELDDRVRRLAGALRGLGMRRGDRVAYLGANDVAVFETLFATGMLGAVFVPLNTRLSGTEIRYMLADSGASVLVHSADTDALAGAAAPLPETVRAVVALSPGTCPLGGRDYRELVEAAEPAGGAAVGLDDPCLILYTSGTTGRPKGAVLTHGNLTWNTVNQLAHVDTLGSDRALVVAPLFHCVGLGQITLPTLFKGGSVEPVPRFDPGAILELIGRRRTTSFSAVPTMLQMMCGHPSWAEADLSSLTCVLYGGSPVRADVARAWLDRGVRLLQGYGMTEAAPGVHMAVADGADERPTSVGVPHFFTDVAHLRSGRAVPAEPGEPAELLVRGPNVFAGYWGRPEDSAASFVEGGWFRTGDLVRVDEAGWAQVADRVKDMIISGGENVYPAEVEAVVTALPQVADCAVVAVPDERWGEVGAAHVVLRPGAALTEAELRAHLEARLARYKIPKTVRFAADLPRTATGKIRRAELRRAAQKPAQMDARTDAQGQENDR
ncbi:acyl-CoA synthetase [Spirillospora sp. CA-253888]